MFFYSHYASTKSLLLLHDVNILELWDFFGRFWVISVSLDSQDMHHTYNNYLQQDISSLTSTLKTIIKIKNKIKYGCVFARVFLLLFTHKAQNSTFYNHLFFYRYFSLQITDLEWVEMIRGSVQLSMSGMTVGP